MCSNFQTRKGHSCKDSDDNELMWYALGQIFYRFVVNIQGSYVVVFIIVQIYTMVILYPHRASESAQQNFVFTQEFIT